MYVWQLFQYVSPNGRHAIDDWRKSIPIGHRAYLDTFLRTMVTREVWEPPDLEPLRGKQSGLTELRWKCGKLPYRIIGYRLAIHQYVMLIGCTHRESYDPQHALETAVLRRTQIENQEVSYREYQLILSR